MAPVGRAGVGHSLVIESGLVGAPDPTALTRALRRAVMARVQDVLGQRRELPPYFSGHEHDRSAYRDGSSTHLAFALDLDRGRLLVIAPHALDRREPSREEIEHLVTLATALDGFRQLRAGSQGLIDLEPRALHAEDDPLCAWSTAWRSTTPYQLTRHAKLSTARDAVIADVREECRRRGLPAPEIEVVGVRGVPRIGVEAKLRLSFRVAVRGPLLLGRSRYFGGGLFEPFEESGRFGCPGALSSVVIPSSRVTNCDVPKGQR